MAIRDRQRAAILPDEERQFDHLEFAFAPFEREAKHVMPSRLNNLSKAEGIIHGAPIPGTKRQSCLKPVGREQHLMNRFRVRQHHIGFDIANLFDLPRFSSPNPGTFHLQSKTLTQRCPREGSIPRASLDLSSEQFSESACPTDRTRSPAPRHAAIHHRKEHGEVRDRSRLAER